MEVKVIKGRVGRYAFHIFDNYGREIVIRENSMPELLKMISQAQCNIAVKEAGEVFKTIRRQSCSIKWP